MLNFKGFKVKPISGAMGAEIFDIDLSAEINTETWKEIQDAWHHYFEVVFPHEDMVLKTTKYQI